MFLRVYSIGDIIPYQTHRMKKSPHEPENYYISPAMYTNRACVLLFEEYTNIESFANVCCKLIQWTAKKMAIKSNVLWKLAHTPFETIKPS